MSTNKTWIEDGLGDTNGWTKTTKLDRYTYLLRNQANEFFIFCKPPGGRWQLFTFEREEDVTINLKNWRIKKYFLSNGSQRTPLEPGWSTFGSIQANSSVNNNSQWEYAVQEAGQVDFSGGYHGDEQITEMGIFIDGKRVAYEEGAVTLTSTMAVGTALSALDLRISVVSKIYRPSAPTTAVATIKREYRFDQMGMTVKYTMKWEVALTVAKAYVAMFPAARSSTSVTKGRYLDSAKFMDISAPGFVESHIDTYGVEYSNDTNDFCVRVEVLNPKVSLNGYANNDTLKTYVSNAAEYNKFYASRIGTAGTYATTIGELWDVAFRVEGFMSE